VAARSLVKFDTVFDWERQIDWFDALKKEARGIDGKSNFGEVQEVGEGYVFTLRGFLHKRRFAIPLSLVESYDGDVLWLNCTDG
jgi:hypothetical protein